MLQYVHAFALVVCCGSLQLAFRCRHANMCFAGIRSSHNLLFSIYDQRLLDLPSGPLPPTAYGAHVFHSFSNAPVRAEVLTPGTTHVAIGFLDLGGLAAAMQLMEAGGDMAGAGAGAVPGRCLEVPCHAMLCPALAPTIMTPCHANAMLIKQHQRSGRLPFDLQAFARLKALLAALYQAVEAPAAPLPPRGPCAGWAMMLHPTQWRRRWC